MIIIIGGIPGSGKTTLMREFRKTIGEYPFFIKEGLLDYELYPEHNLEIWGRYEEGEVFAGTDKLSMAAQRDALIHLKGNNNTILIEGDRFFNGKFFDSIADKTIIVLEADEEIIQERFKQRNSDQSKKFLLSRFTKIQNIKNKYPCQVWSNNTHKNLHDNLKTLRTLL